MDGFDAFLYLSYILVLGAAVAAIVLPMINAIGDPSTLVRGGIGVGALLLFFLISVGIAGNEVTDVYTKFGVDAGMSKRIGGTLIMVYILFILSFAGIIFSEVHKILK